MVAYNWAVYTFQHNYSPSTIYSVVYFVFIPLSHSLCALLVFGWPERYVASLLTNFPIGLTAIAIGTALTAYLDHVQFNTRVEQYVMDNFTFSKMPSRTPQEVSSEFYTSLAVLAVTSVWTYILSVLVNTSPEKSEKKEL
jgi:hypothetical protein